MRLATRDDGTRDGALVVVSSDGASFAHAPGAYPTLQAALDEWAQAAPRLAEVDAALRAGTVQAEPLDVAWLQAPLPRAYEWVDGSAFVHHVKLVRRARGADPPATLLTDPLVYQGGSGQMLAATSDLPLLDEAWGLDFEAEVCVVLTDTLVGTKAAEASSHVALLMLANDVTYRNLIPEELKKGFGFFNSKPATAFSPFAVTPDELGDAWRDGRLHVRVESALNGRRVGNPHAGPEMHFSFFDLVEHICRTRSFVAGTIVGSGTVSNDDESSGSSCLAEVRMREILRDGDAHTPYLRDGDVVEIRTTHDGREPFGTIRNRVVLQRREGA